MTHFQWWEKLCKFFKACLIKITKLWGWNLFLTGWVYNFVMQKKVWKIAWIRALSKYFSYQYLQWNLTVSAWHCTMWKLNFIPEEQFSCVCKALLPLKSKTDPLEEGGFVTSCRMLNWCSCSRTQTWVLLPNDDTFQGSTTCLTENRSQCFVVWLRHEGLCLPLVCLKLKNSICFPLCVSDTSVLIK